MSKKSGLVQFWLKTAALLFCAALLTPASVQAQVAFRSASSASVAGVSTIAYGGEGSFVNRGNCGSITPSLPAGTAAGDLLIVIVTAGKSPAISMPGWTQFFFQSPVGNLTSAIYWRIATGGDPTTITQSGNCNVIAAQISRFTGVDTTQPFINAPLAAGNWSYQNSKFVITGTETTTYSGAMIVVTAQSTDNDTFSALAGFTQAYNSITTTGNNVGMGIYYALQAAPGVSGPHSITKNNKADPNHGTVFALRPIGLNLTLNVPPGTTLNDVMIASVTIRPCSNVSGGACTTAITPPAGWTLVNTVNQTTGGGSGGFGNRLFVYQRVASAAEPVSYTWAIEGAPVHAGAAGGIQSFSGVDTVSPIVAFSGQATASGTGHITPSINTGVIANTMLVSTHSANASNVWTPPAGMTEAVDVASLAVPNNAGLSLEVNYQVFAGPGATGTRTASWTSPPAANTGATHMLALRPAVVVVTPGSFNAFESATAPAAIIGVIQTRISGSPFSLDVVAISAGAQLAAFNNNVKVELLGNTTLGVPLDAQNCPTSSTVVQTIASTAISGGRSAVNFSAVADAWRDVRVRISYPTVSPTVIVCSTDNFAIRPSSFTVAATDSNWSSAGTTRTLANTGAVGGNVHKAGQPFTLTVTPAPGTATNYDGSPTVSALACTLPAVCANGTLTVGAYSGSGTRTSTTASYSEAGAFNLTLVDQTYASVDAGDGTPADCSAAGRYVCQSPAPVAIGRFVPNHFSIAAVTQPVFRTFDATDAACTTPASGPVRSFTYIGQFFGYQTAPAALVIAQNASGVTTTNYRGALWKLVPASVTQTLANSPVLSLDVTQMGASVLSEIANSGTGTLTSNAADKFAFVRNAVTPQTGFTANLALTWSVADANENSANQGVISTTTPLAFNGGGTGVAFDGGGASSGKDILYGRLSVFNANGSNLIALPIRIFAQYWNGTSFIVNTADNCTTLAGTNIEMSNFQNLLGPIASCKTRLPAAITFNSGRARALLLAPGAGVLGSVNLTVHLEPVVSGLPQTCTGGTPSSVTGANRDYLQGNWSGAAYNQNPVGIAIFGVYPGSAETIHTRENY